jgi:hypothetical protein
MDFTYEMELVRIEVDLGGKRGGEAALSGVIGLETIRTFPSAYTKIVHLIRRDLPHR